MDDDPEEVESGRGKKFASPEFFQVKMDLLSSYASARSALGEFLEDRQRGMHNALRLGEFQKFIIELYIQLRPKIRKEPAYKKLYELDKYITCAKPIRIDISQWSIYLNLLADKLDDMGVTRVEINEALNPATIFRKRGI